jgi:hypothetical protein
VHPIESLPPAIAANRWRLGRAKNSEMVAKGCNSAFVPKLPDVLQDASRKH